MSDLRYFNLSIPAPKRLAMMRAAFAQHATKYPHCPEHAKPADWRGIRSWGLHSYASAFGLASFGWNDGPCNTRIPVITSFDRESLPVRSIRYADEFAYSPVDHKGWYADENGFGDRGVIRGIVASLPHRRFLSGYESTDNGEIVLFIGQTFDNEKDAIRDADHEAETYAEQCRDDNARYCAMQDAESHAESVAVDVKPAFEARNVSAWHREHCRDRIEELRAARADLAEKTAEYERS